MSETNGIILITGAAKRIGRVIALRMAAEGWDVVVHCNTSCAEAEKTAEEIRTLGRKAQVFHADLANTVETKCLIPSINEKFGHLSALVNNASLFERDENDPDGVHHHKINFESPCLLSESFFQQLPQNKTGVIINLLDSGPIPDFFKAYIASKKILEQATLEMAQRMAPYVRVNAVALGPCMINPRQSQKNFTRLALQTPLGITVPPEAVASAILFLVENPVITGEILHIDSGFHLSKKDL